MAPDTVPYIVLERHDPTRNMARYYVLSLEPSLFGDTALVRQWGRLGRSGRQRIDLFQQRAHAIETLEAWFARKAATAVTSQDSRQQLLTVDQEVGGSSHPAVPGNLLKLLDLF